MKSDFLIALTQLAAERHLPKEQVLSAIEVALASAFKKDSNASGQNITVNLNPNTGDVSVFALKTVVDTVEDSDREITVLDAQSIHKDAIVGEEIALPEPLPHNASRIAAQTAKQVVLQKLREAERELLYDEFIQHKDDIVSGIIDQVDGNRSVQIDLGRAQAVMPSDEQVFSERYRKGQRLKVFVLDVRTSPKGPEILVSRSHKNLLKRLFEIEVPEVYNGVVEIKAIARDPGFRSKVAVNSTQDGIDPVGSCIGVRGNRIQSIVNELQGEKIDVVPWDDDPKEFIAKALSPSEVVHVELEPSEQTAVVAVPDRQLSLAIGREGQNARLAARLAGWRLDIKGLSEWEAYQETKQLQAVEEEITEIPSDTEDGILSIDDVSDEAILVNELAVEAPPTPATVGIDTTETISDEPVSTSDTPALTGQEESAIENQIIDEDAVLEALIREEEMTVEVDTPSADQESAPDQSLSVDSLQEFTLDDISSSDMDVEEDVDSEDTDIPDLPILTPDAGKIRFAEDIVPEQRGSGRRDRRNRRSGAGANTNRRGGSGR
ncbi:MAG: transcription termination/antitermination protein NusA [SAR202 cluster bacterium]|nr:transcription termination/antitermination protein NusA [SAR202 cluster bacterium]